MGGRPSRVGVSLDAYAAIIFDRASASAAAGWLVDHGAV